MLIEEYSDLMGYPEICSEEEYTNANLAYMMASGMDKKTFCKHYKNLVNNPLVLAIAEAANSREIGYRDKEVKERQTAHALLREADEIREGGMDCSADAIDKIATKLIGRSECIKWKLSKGFRLSEEDSAYITDNLR